MHWLPEQHPALVLHARRYSREEDAKLYLSGGIGTNWKRRISRSRRAADMYSVNPTSSRRIASRTGFITPCGISDRQSSIYASTLPEIRKKIRTPERNCGVSSR